MSVICSSGAPRKLPATPILFYAFAPPRALTSYGERTLAMHSLAACGWSSRRIGRLFGIHGATVGRIIRRSLKRAMIHTKPEPLTAAEIVVLLREYATNPELTPAERAEAIDWLERLWRARSPRP
jgi:hypothetical protein